MSLWFIHQLEKIYLIIHYYLRIRNLIIKLIFTLFNPFLFRFSLFVALIPFFLLVPLLQRCMPSAQKWQVNKKGIHKRENEMKKGYKKNENYTII